MGILFRHNQTAYEAALAMLAQHGRACVIHPTGTGKSFIGFQYAADHPDARVLWLAPSVYIFRSQLENWQRAGGGDCANISFLTYPKLSLLSEEEIADLHPDVIIADELHRLGAQVWGAAFERLLARFPEAQLLGLTATNIRYLDNQRDMAQELFEGHIASEMTLGEAIVRGILPAPKYVLSVFKYRDDLAKYELRARRAKAKATRDAAEEILEKLRRALENAVGLDALFAKHMPDRQGKYLVFCASADHMREMIAHVPEWFGGVDPHPHVYSAYSEDPGASQAFADFKQDSSDHLKLLFCIDMLNEGVHVDDLAGVILLRPTISPIVYKQQIGRALSASGRATPVIFDIVLNIENLYSIGSLEEEMDAAVAYYRSLGEGEPLTESFEVIDEVHDCLTLFDRLNDTLTASWDLMYDQARKYRDENGDLNVPRRYVTEEGYSLGSWLETQRRVRAGRVKGTLTPAQIRLLDDLGMRWESLADQNWEKFFRAAQAYRKEYGDLLVPVHYVTDEGLPLGAWISNLRQYRKSGVKTAYLTPERIAALDALGMQWDVPDYLFERNFAAAAEYHRTHGDLDVPTAYVSKDGIRLGAWIGNLRQRRRLGTLACTGEQLARLDALGMIWGSRYELAWEKGFAHARDYARRVGDLNVPFTYRSPDGYKLGGWIADQREKKRAGSLKEERRRRLDALGMLWEKKTQKTQKTNSLAI